MEQQIIVGNNLSLRSYGKQAHHINPLRKGNIIAITTKTIPMIGKKIYALLFSCSIFSLCLAQQAPCGYEAIQQQLMQSNPSYKAEVKAYLEETLPRMSRENNASRTIDAVITIPVVVHVIHTGQSIGNGANLSANRIQSQIDILNEDYRRANDDTDETPAEYFDIAADTEIQFCLATASPSGSVSNGITRHVYSNIADIDDIENTIKPETSWDPNIYMNIWTIDMPSNTVLGYSYLPTPTIVGFPKDGIVIDYPNFGYVDAGNRGRTCTHEVGHYLGLQHTWGASDSDGDPIGCSSDDGIADTPNCNGPHYGCPTFGIASCGNTDMIMNYMEYVNDDCMNLFTLGQKNVMQSTLNGARSQLIGNASTACDEADLSCITLEDAAYDMGFESDESSNGWVVENPNADTRTWLLTQNATADWGPNNGSGVAVYLWNVNGNTPADDYLFTPCFEVKAGHTYKLSFSYAAAEDNSGVLTEKFQIGFSETQSSTDFNVINDDWIFENVNNPYPDYNDQTLYFEANTTGSTSIGFHAFSDPDKYALQIDDIRVDDLGIDSPVEELSNQNSIAVSPNPSNGRIALTLDFEQSQKSVDIGIYDVLGRLIHQRTLLNIDQYQSLFDLSDFEAGIYFVKVESEQVSLSKKILLRK